jgi:membrane-associated protein
MEFLHELTAFFTQCIDIVLHLDQHLNSWIMLFGPWFYALIFLIVFTETGLVIFPFLPGDSLLFALGALTMVENAYLKLPLVCVTLITAAFTGDIVNYSIGRRFGTRFFSNPRSKIFRREYLDRTHRFYERHGGRTLVMARFVPIVRTFAPFVAGLGQMTYTRFLSYSISGAVLWVGSISVAGAFFGNLPVIKRNFHVVVVAIILISCLPMAVEAWKAKREN